MQAQDLAVLGSPIDVHPLDALLTAVRIAAGEVNYFTLLIQQLTVDEAAVQHEKTRPLSLGKDGEDERQEVKERTTQADLHIWIRARQDALDRLVKYSKTALDAGIDERRVKLAEHTGELMVKFLQHVLDRLTLSKADRKRLPEIVHEGLMLIEGKATERVAA
jgi:hypothetical protein